jgi:hypothetical protein
MALPLQLRQHQPQLLKLQSLHLSQLRQLWQRQL